MRYVLPLCLAFLSFPLSAAGQGKHPFTFEDMMKLKRVGDPQAEVSLRLALLRGHQQVCSRRAYPRIRSALNPGYLLK